MSTRATASFSASKFALQREAARAWQQQVQPGDWVNPDPLWNQTERGARQLAVPCQVVATLPPRGASQSGLLFEVRAQGGALLRLDAGWFVPEMQQGLFG